VRQLIGYPQVALEYGITGSVVVRVKVDTFGNVVDYDLIKKVHPILSQEVEKHAKKLRFKRYICDGRSRVQVVNVPFRFKMNE
jgi:TonB family protein